MIEERVILTNGKVSLLDIMGSDEDVVAAARISYNSSKIRKHTALDNKKLIRYLMRHRHTSVFEMCEVKFYLKVPIFVARQLMRHRTANLNEVSGRYSELPNEFYIPELEQYGPQSTNNKQGRSDVGTDILSEIKAKKVKQDIQYVTQHTHDTYDSLLNVSKISREIARIVLPTAQLTEIIWKCDLHNFFHFLKLRMDAHAQYEIRVMATAMYDLVKPHFPHSCEAWEDYILHARPLSRLDVGVLQQVLRGDTPTFTDARAAGMSEREFNELMSWLNELRK